MNKTFLEFADAFARLSPYELKHLSEVLLCRLESGFDCALHGRNKRDTVSEKDIKAALTDAMRDIALELREREIDQEHIRLTQAKAMMFKPQNIAA